PRLPLTLAGFSFGSRIALRLGCAEAGVRRVIAVGFPAEYHNRSSLERCKVPRVFVQSTHDQYGPVEKLKALIDTLEEPKRLVLVEARDHFFADGLEKLDAEIVAL